jgi:Tfp pilus assembly protein PilF
VKRPLLAVPLLLTAQVVAAQAPDKVIDVRTTRPAVVSSFDALWGALRKAEQKGDVEAQQAALREIRRLRIERNIRSLEPIALGRVARGLDWLQADDRARAEECFRSALGLDPYVGAFRHTIAALAARLPTMLGAHQVLALVIPIALLWLFGTTAVVALALLVRHGGLLRHDLEETLGAGRRAAVPLALAGLALLLPAVTFQGWAWVPLWVLTLLFIYMDRGEKVIVGLLLLAALAVGPLVRALEMRALAWENPLFGAAVQSLEGGPDARATVLLEEAVRRDPEDRDLLYLLATQYRKAGRYDETAGLYRELLRQDPNDSVSLNNLGNLEFAGGEFQAAIARYKQGIDAGPSPTIGATFYYNLSLAHLQRFEYQPAQEARSQADRLAGGLVRSYDNTWKYDRGDYAVVDLGPSEDELWGKFLGTPQGVRLKNVTGRGVPGMPVRTLAEGAINRVSAFLLIFAVMVLGLSRWRGPRMFTRRCIKCGAPFCKRCQIGTAAGVLCTQCHHLFIVRDGVSGPARNQKLLEVQREDERRDRIFRLLSLFAPGAGHIYAQRPVLGASLAALWCLVLSSLLVTSVLSLTEASSALTRPWGFGVAGIVLLGLYVTANRSRPKSEVLMPAGRQPPRGYAA